MGTFGKALGSFGAFVAGPADVMEYLVQSARSYIYTTAMPPALAEATRVSLQLLQNESWRRQHLQALIARFRAAALQLGLSVLPSETAIQPVLLGESAAALRASQQLWDKGFWVSAIRPPTVPQGSARLRITLSAAHQPHQVDALLEALSEVLA
jgi:8-amino-7-oxononanoate synthase